MRRIEKEESNEKTYPGTFISVDGPDASGKSTAVPYLKNLLEARGQTVVVTREPGGTDVGEKLRTIVLGDEMDAMTELLIFAAARAEHIETKIKPALREGKVVLTDRFSDASYAYQGAGRQLAPLVETLERLVQNGFQPDYTLFFDVSYDEAERRMGERRQSDRLDLEGQAFKRRVFEGYQTRFKQFPERMVRINAELPIHRVQRQLAFWVDTVFTRRSVTPAISNEALEALSFALTVEHERAVKQQNEWLKTGVSTAGHGGSHDTCFDYLLRKHLQEPSSEEVQE